MSRNLAITLAAASVLAIAASAASAHALLQRAVPSVGGTVSTSPTAIRLKFSEGVEPHFSSITLQTQAGSRVPIGKPNIAPGDDTTFIAPVPHPLKAGMYTVTWHAVSVDTHKTQGSFQFTVQP